MIPVTRLNGKPIVINADLIRSVEQNPDTTIKLINGETVLVQEEMREIIEKCIDYGRHLRQMMPRT